MSAAAIVIIIYFAIVIALTFRGMRQQQRASAAGNDFSEEFFLGGRKIGPIALAILCAAGACSNGTFLGGPGICAANGIGYMLLFTAQMPLVLFILGGYGKKINIIGRRTKSQSYIDIFRYRFENYTPLMVILIVAIVVFAVCSATAEFVGGARVIETVSGIPYMSSLIAFGTLITLYTVLGGMHGVSIVGVLQGFVMTLATILLFIGIQIYFGGMPQVIEGLKELDPQLLAPRGQNDASFISLFDFFVMYSIAIPALPWATQAALTYKDTKTMKTAIIVGVIITTIWTVFVNGFAGAAGRVIAPDMGEVMGSFDYAVPNLAMETLPPILSGIVLAGIAGAGQSTIASLFILIASTIVVNTYKQYFNKNASEQQIKRMSLVICILIGILNVIFATVNPRSLQTLISFSAGGTGAALLPCLVYTLYWPRCTKQGAFAMVVAGFVLYVFCVIGPISVLHTAPLLISAPLAFIIGYVVSMATPKPPKEALQLYFGEM